MVSKDNEEMSQGVVMLQNIIDFIEEHLLDDLTLDSISKQFYFNRNLLNQLFHTICNMTIMEYIRNRRLTKAGLEVESTKLPLIELAFLYRYETPEAFTKAFKRFHGFPPSFVRRTHAKTKVFSPLQLRLEIQGGWDTTTSTLTKPIAFRQEKNHTSRYTESRTIKGGNKMERQSCSNQICTNEMKQKEDWSTLLQLAKELEAAGMKFKIDGKTMIFAHGLEFPLDKFVLSFLWGEDTGLLWEDRRV